MSWNGPSITMAAAQLIFYGVEITKERIGKYDFYRATFGGKSYGPSTLTNLCCQIWFDVAKPD